ncbi:hypothetical protein YC2023_118587 [Brassica napus]|uniref:(rape) hypothetical protein n=1 Tax=Brassica napus TaxID=3708 RepID=A0A816JDZ2_BRANA|nr:unnamed protein product [Brassica napus]
MLVVLGFGRHRGSDLSVLVFGSTARLRKLGARGHWLWSKVICFGFSVVVARGVRICEFDNCGLVLCGGACGPIQFWRLDLRRVPDISLGEGAGLQSPGEAVNVRIGSFVLRSSFRTGLWASRILPGTVSPCDMSTTYCELLWLRDSFRFSSLALSSCLTPCVCRW